MEIQQMPAIRSRRSFRSLFSNSTRAAAGRLSLDEVNPKKAVQTAWRSARKLRPSLKRKALASLLVKASKPRGRGRPPVDLTGLIPLAKAVRGMSAPKILDLV